MSRASPQMREIAALLIADETQKNHSSASAPPAVVNACERLRPHLAALMGKGGFRAMLLRALALATAEVSWLKEVQVNGDGALEGWNKPQVAANEWTESGMILVAHLLGLLVAFIGINLTLRLVRDVWPKLPLEDLKFTENSHEEA